MLWVCSLVVLVVAGLTGCESEDPDTFVQPDANRPRDAAIDSPIDAPAPVHVAGKVCVLTNLKSFTTCNTTLQAKATLTVAAGSQTQTGETDDDLSLEFEIDVPANTELIWTVKVTGVRTSRMTTPPITPGNVPFVSIPAMLETEYQTLLNANGTMTQDDTKGSLAVRYVRGIDSTGITAVAAPVTDPVTDVLYDAADPLVWDTDATGEAGVVWLPRVTPGPIQVTAKPPIIGDPFVSNETVEAKAITFLSVINEF
jgi:hypothetical protein